MFKLIRNWNNRRIIRKSLYTEMQWAAAFSQLPILQSLSVSEKQALRELTILFLYYKSLEGVQGVIIDDHKRLVIGLQACLPILSLDLGWYDGWVSVVVHPAGFMPERTVMDEFGVEHRVRTQLIGEAWSQGAVVLSWADVETAGFIDGHNLVVHEFAHKLDMLNGVANGFPPLHSDMSAPQWSAAFTEAFEHFQNYPIQEIDRYAATSPAEFFAVLSEVFFECPQVVVRHYPEIYGLLCQFYRQDTLARFNYSASS